MEDNRPRAAQIVQLWFDFARAEAQFSISSGERKKEITIAAGSPDLVQFLDLESNADYQAREASEQVQAIQVKLRSARVVQRRELQAALDAAQSRLAILQAGLATLGQLTDFVRTFTGQENRDLSSTIDDLARGVPDVTSPARIPLTNTKLESSVTFAGGGLRNPGPQRRSKRPGTKTQGTG